MIDYLTNRKQYVTINGTNSNILPIECGVPQGSINKLNCVKLMYRKTQGKIHIIIMLPSLRQILKSMIEILGRNTM